MGFKLKNVVKKISSKLLPDKVEKAVEKVGKTVLRPIEKIARPGLKVVKAGAKRIEKVSTRPLGRFVKKTGRNLEKAIVRPIGKALGFGKKKGGNDEATTPVETVDKTTLADISKGDTAKPTPVPTADSEIVKEAERMARIKARTRGGRTASILADKRY